MHCNRKVAGQPIAVRSRPPTAFLTACPTAHASAHLLSCCRFWAASAKPAAIDWDKAMVRHLELHCTKLVRPCGLVRARDCCTGAGMPPGLQHSCCSMGLNAGAGQQAVRQPCNRRRHPAGCFRAARHHRSQQRCGGVHSELPRQRRRLAWKAVHEDRQPRRRSLGWIPNSQVGSSSHTRCRRRNRMGVQKWRTQLPGRAPSFLHAPPFLLLSYAQKWVAAADAAGYALCVGVGQFSADGLVGNLVTVHNPTPWSGTGKPSTSGVVNAWALPKPDLQGQTISCKVWNGTGYSLDGSKWRGTVPYPAPVDPTQFKVSPQDDKRPLAFSCRDDKRPLAFSCDANAMHGGSKRSCLQGAGSYVEQHACAA